MRKNAIVGFSAEYVAHHRITKHSELNGDMLQQFCDYLRQKSVPYTTEDLKASSELVTPGNQGSYHHYRPWSRGRPSSPRQK